MSLVVLCTAPGAEVGKQIAHALVSEGLAACVSLLPGLTSVYRWEGAVQVGAEVLLLIKTRPERYDALEARVRQLHPYQTPEIIPLPVERGFGPYLDWVAESTR